MGKGKGTTVQDVWDKLVQLVLILLSLLGDLSRFATYWLLLIVWVAWWLLAVNWQRLWPVLARGAWAPVVMLMFMAALVWSRLAPSDCDCLGFVTVANFWWQWGAVGSLAALAL